MEADREISGLSYEFRSGIELTMNVELANTLYKVRGEYTGKHTDTDNFQQFCLS